MATYKILGDQSPVHGTCALDSAYGTVMSGRLRLAGDMNELVDCGGDIDTVLLFNDKYELEIEAIFDSNVVEPVRATSTLTIDGHTGKVLEFEKLWEAKGEVKIRIKAAKWALLGNTPVVTTV